MSTPSFTGTPQWFKVPPYVNGDQVPDYPNQGTPGPYEWLGKKYWIVYDYQKGGSNTPFPICAYESIDGATTQPFNRYPSTFSDITTRQVTSFWNGTSRYVYLTFTTRPGLAASTKLNVATFDMQTQTFSAANDPGVTVGTNFSDALCVPKANGDLVLVWDLSSTPQMYARLFSGGVWSGTVTLAADWLLALTPIGTKVGIFSAPVMGVAGTNDVHYSVFDGVTVSASLSLTVANPLLDFGPWPCLYDPVHDTAICSIPEAPTIFAGSISAQTVFSISPSDGSGGTIVRTAIDTDPAVALERELQYIGANAGFTAFYAMVDQGKPNGADPQLFIYTAPAITGPWSAQSVFYNQNTHNSSPVGFFTAPAPLIYAYSFRVLANGDIAFTAEFSSNSGAVQSLVAGITSSPTPPPTPCADASQLTQPAVAGYAGSAAPSIPGQTQSLRSLL